MKIWKGNREKVNKVFDFCEDSFESNIKFDKS